MDAEKLESCVVSVQSEGGQITKGTSFVISTELVVTCAEALERCCAEQGDWVRLVFPRADKYVPRPAQVVARHLVQGVAFLRPYPGLPHHVTLAVLGPSENTREHAFSSG